MYTNKYPRACIGGVTSLMHSDLTHFKTYLDAELTTWLQTEIAHYQAISSSPTVSQLFEHLLPLADGGKRIRPYLAWSAYHHYKPEATYTELSPLLVAIELFHIFCLIHDDVMDEANTRHGVPTLQTYAAKTFYKETVGLPPQRIADNQAILIGDIVFNSVYKLLTNFRLRNHEQAAATLDIFTTLIDEVCIGQMLDVHLTSQATVTKVAIESKNRLKTAYYTFARPLQLGVTAAGRSDLTAFTLAFGEQLGLLYQLQDDLLDIIGDPEKTKKPIFQDVSQNQHTLLSVFIREQGGEAKTLLDSLAGKTLSLSDQRELRTAFLAAGIEAYAQSCLSHYEETATALFTQYAISADDQTYYQGLLALLTKRTA